MGSCLSLGSREIHEIEYGQENAVYYKEIDDATEIQKVGSVYSQQGSKGINQDAAILFQRYGADDGAFCGVFDGHGKNGHIISKFVRNRLPSLVLNQKNSLSKVNKAANEDYNENKHLQKWKESCISAFKLMDNAVKLQETLDCSCSGSTAVVVIRQGEDLVIANLGDSRAVLETIAQTGIEAVQLTTDLKPCLPSEAERIRKCNGRVVALKEEPHIQRVWLPNNDSPGLAMSRAFGDFLLKNHGIIAIPDVSYHHLKPNDQFLVLASDGVWDVLSNNQVISIVWAADKEGAAARAVVAAATAAWRKKYPSSMRDDCSVICLFFRKLQKHISLPPLKTRAFEPVEARGNDTLLLF